MKTNILDQKKSLRIKQSIIRKNLSKKIKNSFNIKIFDEFFKKINFESIRVVSSFKSINSEISTEDLNVFILKKNKVLCLPVITDKEGPLTFRKFNNNEELVDGYMNIKEPPVLNEILNPDLIFVPCLAFDNNGFRLGYGGGYYDKTLSQYKKNNINFISVGFAFDDQKVNNVPTDKFDIKLDYVITEKKIYSFI